MMLNDDQKPDVPTTPALSDSASQAVSTNGSMAASADDLPVEALKAALTAPEPPQGDTLRQYTERLLAYALQTRDLEAMALIAEVMDANPELDQALYATLNDALETHPDGVYALIRARLGETPQGAPLDSRWLARLKVAAMCSLRVAITDGDPPTVANWLKLIAREPMSYDLGDMLHNGLLAAQSRAQINGELGKALIAMSVKRDPQALETLLNDQKLLAVLPDNLGRLLRDYDGDLGRVLQNQGIEMLMVVLARAARAQQPALFTPAAVEQVWTAYSANQPLNVLPQYQPDRIIGEWIASGASWLSEETAAAILTLMLHERRDDLFHAFSHRLAGREDFVNLLVSALLHSERPTADQVALTGHLVTTGDLSQQQTADVYLHLLGEPPFTETALPLMQQLAWIIQQHPGLTIPPEALTPLLDAAEESRDELLVRIVSKRLMADLETDEDEAVLANRLLRLHGQIEWNNTAHQHLIAWWRGFVRSQTLARLQRLDKTLDGKRSLEDLRGVLQTVVGVRKMLGKRTLAQFAEDVGTAYLVIQALVESFEPSAKRPMSFDQATVRAELEGRAGELSPHEQKILANNLKELGELVAIMGDNRSKASLMRRSDDVDRLLMSGEFQPHSSVDAIKWLAGYLGGLQEHAEDEEE